jgi:hypothetical protein
MKAEKAGKKGLLRQPIKAKHPESLPSQKLQVDYAALFRRLTRRYGEVTPDALESILCPVLIPIRSMDKSVTRVPGQSHYRGGFTVAVTSENQALLVPGRTGKFVPKSYVLGGVWRELAKGRILSVDTKHGVANGEIYSGSAAKKGELEKAVEALSADDFWEVDQYGASAKVLSGLVEYSLVQVLKERGFTVLRMPEDMAKHIGGYAYFDFEVSKKGVTKKLEAKSLWGTNTRFARLIHKKDVRQGYATSSCRFNAQDFFAVSLFLRDGNIRSFAFARSVPKDVKPYGLPRAAKFPEHVNQNPPCQIGDGTWFASLDEVWNLD